MKQFPKDRRGSAILIALIFGAAALMIIVSQTKTIMQQYQTTIRYGLGQSAFHLSESGLELAMHAITAEQLGSGDWPLAGVNYWEYTSTTEIYKGYTATTDVYILGEGNDTYTITALTGIDVGSNVVESAVRIRVEQERSDAEEQNDTGTGVFGYGMVAKNSIKLNHNNPGMKIASYNSDNNFGVPEYGVNTGYDVVVATPASSDYAININNAQIHGAVRSGGGAIGYNSGFNNPNQQDQNATVVGPDSTITHGVDANRLSTDFDGEITEPELPVSEGYNLESRDQNYWQNNSSINLGSWNTPTWVSTERINTNQNTTITIVGDVVIDAQRNLNLGANVDIRPGATLTIMAGENIHINAESIDQQHPDQLYIIAKNRQDVVLNNFDVFTGIINAPNSTVRIAGVGGSPKSQFRGSVVANNIEVTNGAEFYYDTKLGNSSDDDDDDGGDNSGVGSLKLLSWAEIPPSKAEVF